MLFCERKIKVLIAAEIFCFYFWNRARKVHSLFIPKSIQWARWARPPGMHEVVDATGCKHYAYINSADSIRGQSVSFRFSNPEHDPD